MFLFIELLPTSQDCPMCWLGLMAGGWQVSPINEDAEQSHASDLLTRKEQWNGKQHFIQIRGPHVTSE
jgi:hypothetical protein